jgi:hypothetical protein
MQIARQRFSLPNRRFVMEQNRRKKTSRHSGARPTNVSANPSGAPVATGDLGKPLPEDPTFPPGKIDATHDPNDVQTGSRNLIKQAERDISRGLRDTDLHGVPSNVPGPGPAPEQTPGASVPPDGVDVPEGKR